MKLPTDAHSARAGQLFVQAEAELQLLIRNAVNRGANGTARYYRNQLAAVNSVLSELSVHGMAAVGESVSQGYVSGALVAERTLGINGGFSGVHKEAVAVLVDNAVNPLNEAIRTVGRRTEDVFRRAALNDVSLGIIKGSTRKEVTKAFVNNLVSEGVTGFVDKGGRRWSLGAYGSMVARTTTREAVSHGTANRMLENGHDLVTISDHVHGYDECSDYEGNTYSLTGETEGYDVLDQYPPFHPNCVHVLTPAAETFEAFEKAVAEDAATDKPPIASDPFDAAADRVRAVADDYTPPSGLDYTVKQLAPNGLDDPALDLPWASNGETKRQRLNSVFAEAKAKDVDYLTRVGKAIEDEVPALIQVQEERIAEQVARLNVARREASDAYYAAVDHSKTFAYGSPEYKVAAKAELKARNEWTRAKVVHREAMDMYNNVPSRVRLTLLQKTRPGYGTGELKVTKSKVSDMLKAQMEYLPREWADRATEALGKLKTKADSGRAFYSGTDDLIHVRPGDSGTALHEMGHRMEKCMKAIRDAEAAFYKHRTQGEELRKLSAIYPGHGYRESETAREDKFTHAYMGKDYGGHFYELLTMGLEGAFYGRHNMANDPEMVQWVLGVLASL